MGKQLVQNDSAGLFVAETEVKISRQVVFKTTPIYEDSRLFQTKAALRF
jgi:hypothetical protein